MTHKKNARYHNDILCSMFFIHLYYVFTGNKEKERIYIYVLHSVWMCARQRVGFDKSEISAAGARFMMRNHYSISVTPNEMRKNRADEQHGKKSLMKSIEINPFACLERMKMDEKEVFMSREKKDSTPSNIKSLFAGLEVGHTKAKWNSRFSHFILLV